MMNHVSNRKQIVTHFGQNIIYMRIHVLDFTIGNDSIIFDYRYVSGNCQNMDRTDVLLLTSSSDVS